MNCSGHCTDVAMQSGPVRAGFARAIAGVLAFASVGARGKRPPVGPEGLRPRAFPCRTSRKARAAFGASLALLFGATVALGGEHTEVGFVGGPSSGYYNAGEEIGIEVTFDETVTVTGAPTFTLTVGPRARNMAYDTAASSGTTLRFNYSVVDGDVDADGVSYGSDALRGGRIESGNPPLAVDRTVTAIARDRGHRVDAKKPSVVNVRLTSNPGPDRVYGIGDVVEVSVTFDESVTASGEALALTVGTVSRDMSVVGTGQQQTLVFRYTVSQDDEDANGVSVAADALSGTIQDAAGNDATLTLPRVTHQSGHAVDGVRPTDPSLRIVSNPRGGGIYRRGESILVQLGFDEAVRVSGGDEPTLTLQVGTGEAPVARSALYDPGRSGGRALVFRYEVQDSDRDQDGISVAENAVTPTNVIQDSAGNAWDGTHSALSEQRSHRVDGSLPTVRVTSVDVTSVGPYGVGDPIALEVRFSGTVYAGEDDGSEHVKFRFRIGNATEAMSYKDGNGSDTLRFSYEVKEGDLDEDGVGYAANALVGSGYLVDGHDWPVDRTVVARARLSGQVVDGIHPLLLDEPLEERSSPRNGDTYARGESIEIAVMFNERVSVSHGPDLKLALQIGDAAARRGVLVGGDGTDTLIFRYTVQDGDQGDEVTVVRLEDGTVQDLAGNPADVSRIDGSDAFRLNIKVDGVAPGGATVRIVSDAGEDNTYAAGDRIEMEVVFDDDIQVSGRPVLLVSFESERHGALTRRATLERTRPKVLAFAYTVQPGDIDTDGISIGSEALQGGRITDAVGNPVTRSLEPVIDKAVEHRVDAVEPSVDGIAITSDPGPDGTYAAGDGIIVTVTFDEDVYVKGPFPPLALVIAVGAASRSAVYVDGSGTTTLRFRYEVQVGDRDDDGISMGPDALDPEGAISDVAGNLPGRIPAMRRQSGHKVAANGVPTVTSVRILAPPGGRGFRANDRIDAHVVFDRVVHVTGAPVLTLSIGANNRAASFAGGSGTDTLRFHYTVVAADRDDDGISVPANALSEGTITDDTGNRADRRFRAVPPDTRWTVDGSVVGTVNASLAITSAPEAGTTYGLGEDIELEVRFDTVVHATEDPVLVLEIGGGTADAALVSGSGTETLTFRYRVREGDFDDDGISIGPGALREGRIEDGTGNVVERTFRALRADGDHKVDGVSPAVIRVTVVSTPDAGGVYGLNEEIRIEIDFGEEVHVTDVAADLELVLSIGQHSRSATFAGGSGTETLTFGYVVRSDDDDGDGISIGPTALRGGVIEDAAGNPVDRTFSGLAADSGHKVDGVSPSVTAVRIVSTPDANGIYGLNEEIRIEIDFGEEVHVTDVAADLELVLSIGQHSRSATFAGGSGTETLTFGYVVRSDDDDGDGISIGPTALRGGVIEDAAGNPVDRTFSGLAADSGHKVDGVSPSVTAVRIVSTPDANGIYGLNEEIRIEIDFGEEVHVTDVAADLELVLSIGQHSRSATFAGGSGTETLTFGYVVRSDDDDGDGISIGPTALRGGVIEDAAGNPVDRTFSGLAADSRHKVDGVSPSVTAVRIVSTPDANGIYGLNEEIRIEIDFGEEVHVSDAGGDLELVLSIGEHLRATALVVGSGTDTLTFRYAVRSDDHDDDGISIGPNALQGGTIEDAEGNAVNRSFVALAADSRHKVDGISPALTRVRIVSSPGESGFYGLDEEIGLEVQFGEEVHVTGAEDLSLMLSIGEHLRAATLVGGSGTDTLTFRYAVQSDDHDDDGVSIGPNALQGGTIEDAAGNAVVRSFGGLAADSGHKVDGVSPSLTRVRIVSSPGESGFYGLDEEIGLEVQFGEEVHVTGAEDLSLMLSIGEHLRAATLVGGSGTDTLTFRYAVQSDDHDDDGVSIGPNALQGGTIEDAAGNAVVRSFGGLAADSGHKVDGVSPSLTRVRIVSSPGESGFYGLDEEIGLEVQFGEEVHVTGAEDLSLMLSIGEHLRAATLVGGSGTDTLTFRYAVQSDDDDDDGVSIGPNALQGGTIEDAAGNAVVRSFGGLAADSGHKVDGVSPSLTRVRIVSSPGESGFYGLDEEIGLEVQFGEEVHVTGAEDLSLMLSIGEHLRAATLVGGSGTDTLTFRYAVQSDDDDDDGVSIGPNALQGGTIEDAAGNAVVRSFGGLAADSGHKVDGVSPSLTAVRIVSTPEANGFYGLDEAIIVEVYFGEEVHVTEDGEALALALSLGESLRRATLAGGSGTDTLTFRYVIQENDSDEDGISIGPNALQGGAIEDAAGNPVDRTFAGLAADDDHRVDGVRPVLTQVEHRLDAGRWSHVRPGRSDHR